MIQEKRLLDEFLELIQIDSESTNEKAMGECLVKKCRELGLEVWTDEPGSVYEDSNGFNVYARLEGEGEPYLLSAHMDTVVPGKGIKPVIKDGVIYSDGTTILGGDDKSGIAGILEAVRVIREQNLPHRPAEIIFSVGEEIGMRGAKFVDTSKLQSKKAFVLDSSGDVGKIIIGAPGQNRIFAYVYGKTSHAGLAPEAGINAIQVAARGIAKMNLLRIDEETTCNIATFESIFPNNIVPDKVRIKGEVRSRNIDKLQAQTQHIVSCLQQACDEGGARLELTVDTNYLSYQIDPEGELVAVLKKAFEKIGITPVLAQGGGGSDANIYNKRGLDAVVLGTGMSKVHTKEEFITIENLNKCAELCLALLTV